MSANSDPLKPAQRSKPLRVLFIGNSQVNSICDLAAIVEGLSRSASNAKMPEILTEEIAIGGARLEDHWKDGRALSRIAAGGWDWVVIHEIIYSYGGTTQTFQEYARKFDAASKQAGARMIFYATGETERAKTAVETMYTDAVAMARECRGRVAGGGVAWLRAWTKRPDFDFHAADRAHPNSRGFFLNACVIYAALTDTSPVGLDVAALNNSRRSPEAELLSQAEANFLEEIAWEQYHADRAGETA